MKKMKKLRVIVVLFIWVSCKCLGSSNGGTEMKKKKTLLCNSLLRPSFGREISSAKMCLIAVVYVVFCAPFTGEERRQCKGSSRGMYCTSRSTLSSSI